MKTITVLSQKGGAGKTNLTVHLASCVRKADWTSVILDSDVDQWNAYKWNQRRPERTQFAAAMTEAKELRELKEMAERNKIDLAIIDTAPRSRKEARIAVELADLVLIPCQPAAWDVEALMNSVTIARLVKTPYAVVLSMVPQGKRLVQDTREELKAAGIPVLKSTIRYRAAYKHAALSSFSVHEYEPGGDADQEIDQLFGEVMLLLAEGGDHGDK